ncbi:MAG: hypothetical protein Q9214_001994 [Letrouitia sp. 1 TL-2023]
MTNRAQPSSNGISHSLMSTPDHDQGNREENHPYNAPIPNFDHLAVPGPMTHLPSSRSFNASLDRLNQGTPVSRRPGTGAGQQASTDGHEDAGRHTNNARNDAATVQQEATAAAAATEDSIAPVEQLHNAQQDLHQHRDSGGVNSTVPSTNEAVTAPTAPTTPQQTEPQSPTIQPPVRRSPDRLRHRRRQRALRWLQRTLRHPLPWNQNRRHDLRYAVNAVRRVVSRGL